jgi:chorismate dehydratase
LFRETLIYFEINRNVEHARGYSIVTLRISLVDYLNSAPLGWSFLHGPLKGKFKVIRSSPAECADQLARGEVDVGLIPSIEYQRIPDLRIIPGIAVAASNRVRSVLLVRPKEKPEIRSVALDTSSRTSATLVRILLERRMGLRPELVPHRPDVDEMLARCDSALIIGDAALKLSSDEYEVVDLAQTWIEWQKRPFVFAFWACRSRLETDAELVAIFHEARNWGLGVREEIADVYSGILDLSEAFLREYLHFNVDYNLGPTHVDGLTRFFQLAFEMNAIPELRPLDFLPSVPIDDLRLTIDKPGFGGSIRQS